MSPAKSRRPMVAPTNLFFIATTPSLRDTSPQGEAFGFHCGVLSVMPTVVWLCYFSVQPPARRFVTPLLKEKLFWLPLRGAVGNANCGVAMLFLLSPPLRHFVTPLLKERLFGSHRGELSTQLTEVWLLPEVVCAVPYYLDNQRSPLRISIIIDYLFVRRGHRPPTRFIYIYCISKGTLNFSVPLPNNLSFDIP